MTSEEKTLLLKDLCSRLPYGVICRYEAVIPLLGEVLNYGPLQEIRRKGEYFTVNGADCLYEDVKPYLRSMSSMTEEEQEEFVKFHCVNICPLVLIDMLTLGNESKMFDWLNAHHFDYHGLIPIGLALEAPKNMYK